MEEIEFGKWSPSIGPPATLGELRDSTIEYQRKVENENAARVTLQQSYDKISDEIKITTGQDVIPPHRRKSYDPFGYGVEYGPDGIPMSAAQRADPLAEWQSDLDKLAEKHPNAMRWDDLKKRPEADLQRSMQGAEERNASVMERRGLYQGKNIPGLRHIPILRDAAAFTGNLITDLPGTIVQFEAGLEGQLSSPADLAVLGLSGVAGSANKSLIKNAFKNAEANALGTAALQPQVQANREAGGLEHGWGMALDSVGGAFATGGALDLAFRGPSRSIISRYGRDTPADTFLSKNTPRGGLAFDVEDPLAVPPKPVTRSPLDAALVAKAEAGDINAIKEIAVRTGANEDPAVRGAIMHAELGGKVDEQMVRAMRAMGVDDGEGLRTFVEIARGDGKYTRMPEPIAAGAIELNREGSALAHTPEFQQIVGSLDGKIAKAVTDAVAAGIPDAVEAAKAAMKAAPDNIAATFEKGLTEAVEKAGGPDRFAAMAAIMVARMLPKSRLQCDAFPIWLTPAYRCRLISCRARGRSRRSMSRHSFAPLLATCRRLSRLWLPIAFRLACNPRSSTTW